VGGRRQPSRCYVFSIERGSRVWFLGLGVLLADVIHLFPAAVHCLSVWIYFSFGSNTVTLTLHHWMIFFYSLIL